MRRPSLSNAIGGILVLSSQATAYNVLDLSQETWTVSNYENVSVPGSLPSVAHLDLFHAGVIQDPNYGLADFNLRWVVYSNWTWTSDPISGLDASSDTSTYLVFNGLDTFATIEFGNVSVASTNNMFRQWYFDVSDIVSQYSGSPVLSLDFGSAPLIANQIADEPGQETWPEGVEIVYEFPNRQFIRKEQSDFGWDWGQAFAPAGPWQPAYVVQLGLNEIYVRNSLVDIYRLGQLNNLPPDQSQPWVLNVSLDYLGSLSSGASLGYTILDLSNTTVSSGSLENVTTSDGVITGSVVLDADSYDLWWPNGLGAQSLYYLTVDVQSNASTTASVTKRVGFRTIVLNEGVITDEQLAQGIAPGNNWHFEINGQEFFAKGSNFIPPDNFWPNVTETSLRKLFQAVIAGNQNMLRVWASGAYSPDFMYDIADEVGVLLWSEFEFGDSLYPVNEEFLENVAEEALYQVRRVNHHPSLAYWAGGNELENLELSNVKNEAPDEYEKYKSEYETLFLDLLVPIVFGNTKSISYSPSSSGNGYQELDFSLPVPIIERYDNTTPGSLYGDTDHYDYDSTQAFNLSSYPVGRFANEFGYHSMPSLQSWQGVIDEDQLFFNSTQILGRNRHYPPGNISTTYLGNSLKGQAEMTEAAENWYPIPDKTDSVANFSAWCRTTQIFQADYYGSQIQYYRRGSGKKERNLGSLYWQLEDQYVTPTWAGLEQSGRWKTLHYISRDLYQPVIISPFYNTTTGDLEVYVTSDLWESATGTARFQWYDWSGNPLNTTTTPTSSISYTVGALNTTLVLALNTNTLPFNLTDAVLTFESSAVGALPNSANATTTFSHKNFFHPVALKDAGLVDPGLTLTYNEASSTFTVAATSGVAVWTWLDYPAGAVVYFDRNAFLLAPGESVEIGYTVIEDWTGGEWVSGVTVESLWDNYVS